MIHPDAENPRPEGAAESRRTFLRTATIAAPAAALVAAGVAQPARAAGTSSLA